MTQTDAAAKQEAQGMASNALHRASHNEWRASDAVSSYESAIEGLRDDLKASRWDSMHKTFQMLTEGSMKTALMFLDEQDQKALQPMLQIAQMAAGGMGMLAGRGSKGIKKQKLAEKIDKLEKATKSAKNAGAEYQKIEALAKADTGQITGTGAQAKNDSIGPAEPVAPAA